MYLSALQSKIGSVLYQEPKWVTTIYRVELATVGLHCQMQVSIDYVDEGGKIHLMSIVPCGARDGDLDAWILWSTMTKESIGCKRRQQIRNSSKREQ